MVFTNESEFKKLLAIINISIINISIINISIIEIFGIVKTLFAIKKALII
ncbi:hypothetical protein JP0076_13870 [Helicobacter pylori]|nr:hypothetical protein JP0076_13870 [Helicobacter pylori]